MQKTDNRREALTSLVAAEAWRRACKGKVKTAPVHVDVTFKGAVAVGGEEEAPVSFRLGLKRAEVRFILDDAEVGQIIFDEAYRDVVVATFWTAPSKWYGRMLLRRLAQSCQMTE